MNKQTYTAPKGFGGRAFTMDAMSSSGFAFLESELEKLDPSLREPLTSFTYPRDITVETGGGWVDTTAAMYANYGIAGGSGSSGVGGGAANAIRVIQAEMSKDTFKVLPYEAVMQVKYIDLQRGNITGRSLESIYNDGIRLDFDKFMDKSVYEGFGDYGTKGILNQSGVTATAVASNEATTPSTLWRDKTPDQILADINKAITETWATCEYDQSAVPNHILIDPNNFAFIASQKVSLAADKTILEFLLANNIAKVKGVSLEIADCRWCEGAGANGKNRMVVYNNTKRFISMDLAVPLTRVMTSPNTTNAAYDSLYMANVGQVKVHYTEAMRYADGI